MQLKSECSKVFLHRAYYILSIIATLSLFFLLLEHKYPYYFLQDDNRHYFLPLFVHDYRSLLNGEIPFFNFHQLLGTPALAVGLPASLYPFVYLSVFLSKSLWGHYFAAIDILVFLHLIIAGIGLFILLQF